MDKVLCVYHKDCIDGYAAAWVVGHACGFENVEFVAANYGDALPVLEGREVYIVDFSYDPAELSTDDLKQMAKAKRLVMLDHHETAYANWKDVPLLDHWTFRYEPAMSGVGVAWRWFFGGNKAMPMPLQLIQDRDLWQFQLEGSREFHAVAVSYGLLREAPTEHGWLGQLIEDTPFWLNGPPSDIIMIQGKAIIRDQKNLIQTLLQRAHLVSCRGYEVPLCQVPYDMRSDAGFWLSLKYPFSITYDDVWSDGVRKYSFRSNKKTGIDVMKVTQPWGGGGHKHASGFTVPIDLPFPFLAVQGRQLKLDFEDK
jgi:oligoribonuclease NrnB/cAMP/cGMP phosphodiesterase (DHH superfamily)